MVYLRVGAILDARDLCLRAARRPYCFEPNHQYWFETPAETKPCHPQHNPGCWSWRVLPRLLR